MSISPVFFLFQTHHAWTHATYVLVCLLGVLRTQGRKPKDARTQGRVRLPPIQLLRNERGLLQTND